MTRSLPPITAAEDLAAGTYLELSATGVPERPLILLDVDALRDADPELIHRVAARCRASLAVTVGILRGPHDPRLRAVLQAVNFTLTDTTEISPSQELVPVDDLGVAAGQVWAAVHRNPQAAVACAQLLRQTRLLDTVRGLAAEAAVFSMLLTGAEFRRWLDERGPGRKPPPPAHDLVRIDRAESTLSIVLDHPERRNSLSFRLREELLAAMELAELDPSITEVELSGAGPAFCSGGDLAEFGSATDAVAAYMVRMERAPWRVMDRIADRLTVRMHGACIGAGAEMAAFGGTVVAAPNTFIAFPEVGMGLIPGAGGTVSVVRRIRRWRASWLMLTGNRISAATALRWGLVDRIAGTR